jgi:ClpP class serine protease
LVIQTTGGTLPAMEMIINAILHHQKMGGKVTAYIPICSFSAGTFIALACDEIVMTETAVLGPIDAQIAKGDTRYPARNIVDVADIDMKHTEGLMLIREHAEKTIELSRRYLQSILQGKYDESIIKKIEQNLMDSGRPHSSAIGVEELKTMGLKINTEFPEKLYDLFLN